MTSEKQEQAVKWLTEEVRSLRMAPAINGCGPENWVDLLEIMETCLEAVRDYHFPDTRKMVPLTLEQLRGMDDKAVRVRVLESDCQGLHTGIVTMNDPNDSDNGVYAGCAFTEAALPLELDMCALPAICGMDGNHTSARPAEKRWMRTDCPSWRSG